MRLWNLQTYSNSVLRMGVRTVTVKNINKEDFYNGKIKNGASGSR